MSDLNGIFPEESQYTESFGDYLRRHREASGKTLDGISRTTRISKRYLQAFEDNDIQRLPEDAFSRGFLKSYAKELGIDIDEALARYDQFKRSFMPTQIREIRQTPHKENLRGGFSSFSKQRVWLVLVTLVMAVAVIGVVVWQVAKINREEGPVQAVIEGTSEAQTAEMVPAIDPKPLEPVEQPAVEAAKPSILLIVASKDGSVQLRLDEGITETVVLKAGEKKVVQVPKEVEIRIEDRSAFQFQFNGKPLDISGPVIKLFNRYLFTKKP